MTETSPPLAGGRRATQVTLDLECEGEIATEMSTTFDVVDYDAEAEKWQPKHERFAQLLALRNQKRKDARVQNALDDIDDEVQSSPRTRAASLSMSSSFAGLPPTQRQLIKIVASIDQAQEEAKQEREREEMEREAARADAPPIMGCPSSEAASGGLSKGEFIAANVSIRTIAQAIMFARVASKGSSTASSTASLVREPTSRIEVQGLEHIGGHHQERVMTLSDLALRHRIPIFATDTCGTESYMQMVEEKDAPLIPKAKLMVADEAPRYELPDVAAAGKAKKSKLFPSRGAQSMKTMPGGGDGAGVHQAQRLSIPELMKAYDDHCLVADKALERLRLSNTGASIDPRLVARLRMREENLICEPIPGIRTLLYFPSSADASPKHRVLPEDRRVAQLESCARRSSAMGLRLCSLPWEFLSSQAPGCLGFGCHRSFHSVFSYVVVLHPRRFYLNLERMCRGLTAPLTLRKVVYLCFGRSLDELDLWKRLYGQYKDAKRQRQVRQWVERFAAVHGDVKAAAEVVAAVDGMDDAYASLADDAADPLDCRPPQADVALQRRNGSSSAAREYAHPFGLVDYVVDMIVRDVKEKDARRASLSATDASEGAHNLRKDCSSWFSVWFHTAEAPLPLILQRFQAFLHQNTSHDELVETYLTFLPLDAAASRRSFLCNVDAGVLPASSVWLPPNTSVDILEALENNVSAKAVSDRDARMLMQCLASFRTKYFYALSSWIGSPKEAEQAASFAQATKRRKATPTLGASRQGEQVPPPSLATLGKRLLAFAPLPPELFTAVSEDMHPDWPAVEGWDKPDFGGQAQTGVTSSAPKKSKKKAKDSNDRLYGSAPKTVVQGDMPVLESTSEPFVPSPPDEEATSASVQSDDESADDDGPANRSASDEPPEGQPHPRFSDFDVLTLYHGQGLFFEAFVKLLCTSPSFLRDMMGLVLRFAVYFQSL